MTKEKAICGSGRGLGYTAKNIIVDEFVTEEKAQLLIIKVTGTVEGVDTKVKEIKEAVEKIAPGAIVVVWTGVVKNG